MTTSNATWGKAGRSAAAPVTVQRLADTVANRALLQSQAAADRLPSALVGLGQDVALISGPALQTVSRLARTLGPSLAAGDAMALDAATGTVLYTDDGFGEIPTGDLIVAVIDTGLDIHHPAFAGRVVKPYNVVDDSQDVTDVVGHGTHVAGIVAGALGDDGRTGGVASQVKIMPIKADRGRGALKSSDLARAIRYAADNGAKVINLSLGASEWMPYVEDAVRYAETKGALVVAASGNQGKDAVSWPAVYADVLSVGSSRNGKRSHFSNRGDRLDVSGPGEQITSTLPGGTTGKKSGTSMSSPYVAGAAALVMAQHPDWTPAQVRTHLKRAVNDLGTPGWDRNFGYGELNLFKAVYGTNLPEIMRSAIQPKPSLWQRFLEFLHLA